MTSTYGTAAVFCQCLDERLQWTRANATYPEPPLYSYFIREAITNGLVVVPAFLAVLRYLVRPLQWTRSTVAARGLASRNVAADIAVYSYAIDIATVKIHRRTGHASGDKGNGLREDQTHTPINILLASHGQFVDSRSWREIRPSNPRDFDQALFRPAGEG